VEIDVPGREAVRAVTNAEPRRGARRIGLDARGTAPVS
jgi:hypothetical protein